MLDPVVEFNPLDDLGQPVLAVEFTPFLPGRQHQLVRHRQRGLSVEASLGFGGRVPDGGERALDGVRGSDALPVLGGEVVEGEQVGAVLGKCRVALIPTLIDLHPYAHWRRPMSYG